MEIELKEISKQYRLKFSESPYYPMGESLTVEERIKILQYCIENNMTTDDYFSVKYDKDKIY
jgi:hypothetical protein